MKQEKIVLGDGLEYTMSVLTVGDLIEIENKYGSLQLNSQKIEPIMFWFWLAIRRAHKDIPLEKLYDLVDAPFISSGGMIKIFDTMSRLNGWDKNPNVQGPVVEKASA